MPTTANRKLSIPTTGSEVGVWGSNDLNPNFNTLDGILGSVTSINAASGSVTLTDAQQQAAVIRITGASAGISLFLTQPGFWIIDNQSTGSFVAMNSSVGGQFVTTPPGSRYQVGYDGTNAFFVNLGVPGTLLRLAVASTPQWMTVCSVLPYLPCVGGTQNISSFPALAALLGTTFGGNGSTTFGIPDLRGRVGFDTDQGTGRLGNIIGTTIGAAGGQEFVQISAANLPQLGFNGSAAVLTANQNNVGFNFTEQVTGATGGAFFGLGSTSGAVTFGAININYTPGGTVNTSSPNSITSNVPPALVSGLTFIKT